MGKKKRQGSGREIIGTERKHFRRFGCLRKQISFVVGRFSLHWKRFRWIERRVFVCCLAWPSFRPLLLSWGCVRPTGLCTSSGLGHRVQPHRGCRQLQRGGAQRREERRKAGAGAPSRHSQCPEPRQGRSIGLNWPCTAEKPDLCDVQLINQIICGHSEKTGPTFSWMCVLLKSSKLVSVHELNVPFFSDRV